MDKDADESLRVTADTVNTSIIQNREFTWNISLDERAHLQNEATEIIPIEQPKRHEDLRLPNDKLQVEKTLINAQTKANIALTMGIAATHQQLDDRSESECMDVWFASTAEIGNSIGAARQANLYGFKADQQGIHYLIEALFDATNRLKGVHQLNHYNHKQKRH
ncbi:MAG: hypothetical protein EZS28_035916 [Streblomastix strix]|uniref:Uncharacterized protein n=1 Tax=Streblomastix strix TaxID=222440 RepID=A0A5J4UCN1_9EUKA|nr:MAG: hypothetical protein EZS28_035916 [Streblomastix strix]